MENIKLVNNSNKYLTNSDDNYLEVKSKQTGLKQKFSYNVQGELVTNNKCVTANDDSVYLGSCTDADTQKWQYNNGIITPQDKTDKCLEAVNGKIVLKNCDNSEFQRWNKENTDENDNFTWQKYKGKNVVLVESDNPWYLYNNDKYELKYNSAPLDNNLKYRDNAEFYNMQVLDSNKPNLGLGYSYADRQSIGCNKIEGFNGENDDSYSHNNNNMLIAIIVLLILFLVFHFFIKKY
jgi:hypothetical protein